MPDMCMEKQTAISWLGLFLDLVSGKSRVSTSTATAALSRRNPAAPVAGTGLAFEKAPQNSCHEGFVYSHTFSHASSPKGVR